MTIEDLKQYAQRASSEGQTVNPDWLLMALETLEVAVPCPHFITPQGQGKCIQCNPPISK